MILEARGLQGEQAGGGMEPTSISITKNVHITLKTDRDNGRHARPHIVLEVLAGPGWPRSLASLKLKRAMALRLRDWLNGWLEE
jgi:hypothetical protein